MAINSKEIIEAVEKKYPQVDNSVTVRNCSDLDIEGQVRYGHQYLIGVAHSDPLQAACEHYQDTMSKRLLEIGLRCDFMVRSFMDDEVQEAKVALQELSEHFDANLDVERMIRKLNIGRQNNQRFFIVVTIVFIPLISIIQEEEEG